MADPKSFKTRLLIVFSFFLIALGFFLFRLGFIQLFKFSQYLSIVQNQSRVVIEMPPARGQIVDRNGRTLALDVRLDSVSAVSRKMKHKEKVADTLSRILGLDRSFVLQRLKRDKLSVWIARKITDKQAAQLRAAKIQDLEFVKESQRVYPKGLTACHLVGFTDIDNNGLEGIELNYNSFLKGVPGWRLAQRDAHQRELISKELSMVSPVDGYNIHLTIDEVIQAIAEKELETACKKHNAIGGSVIVMEPKTGDILAMAITPRYDPNEAGKSKPEARRNRAITDLFEPGSVFKSFTLSAILDNKAVGLDERFNCENGAWAVAGKVLHDHGKHGVMSLREIIERSSNIGTTKAAMRLGADRFYKTVRAFGFGERTGIALAGEINGIVPNPRNWSRSSIINLPIGQGIAVTPIQLASAMNAIANNGVLMKPRIISLIDDLDGKPLKSFEPEPVRQAISKETSLQVRSVLEGVVSRGTGKKAAVPGFKAAGKTGTAQKLLPNGAYSHDHFTASFVGFVPYDEPKVVISVSIDEPHPVYFGGEVAAPVFSHVASGTLAYWRISQTEAPSEVVRQSKRSLNKKSSKSQLKSSGLSRSLESGAQLGTISQ